MSDRPFAREYTTQLTQKETYLKKMLSPFQAPAIEVHASPPQNYRMRAEFRVWHDGDDLYQIMFDPINKQRIRIDQFPPASELINLVMYHILPLLRSQPILRYKLFQIDYLSSLSGEIVVSLLYHRVLDDVWCKCAKALCQQMRMSIGANFHLIGRAAKQKICLDQDFVNEMLTIQNRRFTYRQVENSFTQPNAYINAKMLQWAVEVTQDASGNLLELYCGNGNFSLPLSYNFKYVLATEVAKSSVAAAQLNITANNITNVRILRLSAEELTLALQGIRTFRRLNGINLRDYPCETLLVDPPRCGIDKNTLTLAKTHKAILYVSCDPKTLCENLHTLCQSHQLSRVALFDQFPYTPHIECGVWLTKREKSR